MPASYEHAIPGVNAGYICRDKLLEDHLRAQQQAISNTMFDALGDLIAKHGALRSWLGQAQHGRRSAPPNSRRSTRCRLLFDI